MSAWSDAIAGVSALGRVARRLRPWARGQAPILTGAWLAMVGEVMLRLAEPWPLKVLFDHLFHTSKTGWLSERTHSVDSATIVLAGIGGMVVISLLRAACSWAATVGLSLVGNRVLTRCRKDLFDHLLRLPLSYHLSSRRGDLLNRVVGDVGRVQEVAVTALLPLATHVLTLVGMLGVMVWMDVRLGLVALAVVPAFVLVSTTLGRRIRVVAREQRRREGDMASSAGEALGAIRVVQAYGLESFVGSTFDRQNDRSLLQGARSARLSAGLERSVDVIIAVAGAVIVFMGAHRALEGQLSPGDLVVFVSYLRSAFRPVKDAAKFAGRMAKAAASGERILEVLDAVPEVRDRADAIPLTTPITSLEFRDVSFEHLKGVPTLRNVNFEIARGQRLVLVGASGAGKSTVLNLILRMFDPVGGSVRINGRDARAWTLTSLRACVAVVLQESVLLHASIHDNIACASPGATRGDVERAARLAGAHEFISALPCTYDTIVAERGETLSGGQRQRIAIARAAVRDASVLLLDEPTVGLDQASKTRVLTAIEEMGRDRIVVMIAHDLSDLRDTDVVLLLEAGTVVECGQHTNLLRVCGSFASLVRAQQDARTHAPETAHALPG